MVRSGRLITTYLTEYVCRRECTLSFSRTLLHKPPKKILIYFLLVDHFTAAQAVAQKMNDEQEREHQANGPVEAPGMRVQVFGLTSQSGQAINGRQGIVQDKNTKPGRAAVWCDLSFIYLWFGLFLAGWTGTLPCALVCDL